MSFNAVATACMVRVALEVSGVQTGLGARDLTFHGAPPRVTWIATSEKHGAPRKVGPSPSTRNLVGIELAFDAHCWGATFAQAELLRSAVLRALHAECVGSWIPGGATWAQPGQLDQGELCVVRGTLLIPVPETAAPTITIATVAPDATGSVAGDGNLDVSEP